MIPPLAAGDATTGDTSNRDTTANNATTANYATSGDARDTPTNTTAGDIVNVCGLSTNVAVAASG
ncbi:hypothetical protein [Candidatus Poriferisodalis sp.]|uniref:hypothetical protein n=1 Tax=Candidatus Poriferisodalis sp. TaxID=3101277 RepID=UPI003B526C25